MVSASAIQAGRLHRFSKRLVAFEHSTASGVTPKNILLWVGGLGDGLSTVVYPQLLAKAIPVGWSLAQVELLSAHDCWGMSSLQADVKGIADCVSYFRKEKQGGKIVLMGHSTGCQDGMEYTTGPGYENRPTLDGVILQAPVSDREASVKSTKSDVLDRVADTAKDWIKDGRGLDVLPGSIVDPWFGSKNNKTYITAYRANSLIATGADDDYFSSDLPDSTLKASFGSMKKTPLLILFSGKDEHMDDSIDKRALGEKWARFVKEGGGMVDDEDGCVVEGASHNLNHDPSSVFEDLKGRVVQFLTKVDRGEFRFTPNL